MQALGKDVTAFFLIGWGIGGLIFGALGDRYGRAKMLTITVLIYSVCTGFSFFSQTYWDFALARFLTGVGVGGVFGLAVALIAETLPDRSRSGALGLAADPVDGRQSVGGARAVGHHAVRRRRRSSTQGNGWRWMFLVGALPALMVVFTMKFLREPEPWLRAKAEGRLPQGSILTPYRGPAARAAVAEESGRSARSFRSAGVIGLWAIGEYAIDLQVKVFRKHYFKAEQLPEAEIPAAIDQRQVVRLHAADDRRRGGHVVHDQGVHRAGSQAGVRDLVRRARWRSTLYVFWAIEHAARRLLDDAADVVLLSWACSRGLRFICRSCFPAGCAARARRSATTWADSPRRAAASSRRSWRPTCYGSPRASSRRCRSGTRR